MKTRELGNALARIALALAVLGLGVVVAREVRVARAAGVAYQSGDVFIGVGGGQIAHYSAAGALRDTLSTSGTSREDTGMCFDKAGDLFSTNFDGGNVSKFDNQGNLLSATFGGPFSTHPESCVFDNAGNIYVSEVDGANVINKFDPSGALLATYTPASQSRGIDWMDLTADQCTMYYTSEGSSIKRFDVCTNTQLSDFATNLPSPCYALRIRSNGEVIVACTSEAIRFDPLGNQLMTYPITTGGGLFAMNLDPDSTSFWTAGYTSGTIYRIDIASGATLTTFTAPHTYSVAGLAIFGERTVGCTTCNPTPTATVPGTTPTPTLPGVTPTEPEDTATPTVQPPTPTEVDDTATPTPAGSLSVSPARVTPFQTLTITGTYFAPLEPIVLWWDTTKARPIGSATSSIGGAFVVHVSVPQTVAGRHAVIALGTESLHVGVAVLTVQPLLLVKPAVGPGGSRVTAWGFGFGSSESVRMSWASPGGQGLGTTTSNAVGSFYASTGITFTVPLSATGSYPVFGIGQTSRAAGAAFFTIR